MVNIAIFASGGGSNAAELIRRFNGHSLISIQLIVCNKKGAGVIDIASREGIEVLFIDRSFFYQSNQILNVLKNKKIDFIVLAGFLWLIPEYLITTFPDKIFNIHPSLLPKYGGKGMYGHFVHEAVKANGEKETGLTIHLVNQKYDEGKILFQAACPISKDMTSDQIAGEVLKLEHLHYATVIENYIALSVSKGLVNAN
ncbi:MAG: phosphoribosylglycinamide formyltransferase [Saprospiraceae bacterium]|nr:phosphoribosylglycinamide formyltransferase [Saprospiraceae bacterium]